MGKKRHTSEEIVAKLRQVDVLTARGGTVAEAIRQIGVTKVTYYRSRSEYGGLKAVQIKRLKKLEMENARLRRDELLKREIFYTSAGGKGDDRKLGPALQHGAPSLIPGLPATRTRGRGPCVQAGAQTNAG